MNEAQAKTLLLQQKAELEARLARTHKHIHGKEAPVSPRFSEQVKETENDELVYALEAEGKAELQQINHALQRLDAGTYFTCSACGGEIGAARLAAVPCTDLCIDCAS